MKELLFFISIIFISATGFSQTENLQTKTANADTAKQVMYTCSMHPEIQSDKPGNCPKCGMQLVEKSKLSDSKKMKMMHPMMMGGMNNSNHKRKFSMMIIMGTMMAVMAIAMIVSHNR
ncbi:MAG: hypothetical protein KGL19_15505 [Bacteroidota bacterium]|nr:hypothetical protein [Bacteroidota bacterium]